MHKDIDGLCKCLIVHVSDACHAENVCDLVWVDKHGSGAVRDYRLNKTRDSEHARFYVHMTITQAWNDVATVSLDDFGLLANTVGGIRAAISKSAFTDGYVLVF